MVVTSIFPLFSPPTEPKGQVGMSGIPGIPGIPGKRGYRVGLAWNGHPSCCLFFIPTFANRFPCQYSNNNHLSIKCAMGHPTTNSLGRQSLDKWGLILFCVWTTICSQNTLPSAKLRRSNVKQNNIIGGTHCKQIRLSQIILESQQH